MHKYIDRRERGKFLGWQGPMCVDVYNSRQTLLVGGRLYRDTLLATIHDELAKTSKIIIKWLLKVGKSIVGDDNPAGSLPVIA